MGKLLHADLTDQVIKTFFEVYNELGHGFIESVYENSLVIALREKDLEVCQQIAIPVWFHGVQVGDFDADIMVDRTLLLELKAVRAIDPAHVAELLNYLKATDIEVGFLLNFGPKPEFKRLVFDNPRKRPTRQKADIGGILSVLFQKD